MGCEQLADRTAFGKTSGLDRCTDYAWRPDTIYGNTFCGHGLLYLLYCAVNLLFVPVLNPVLIAHPVLPACVYL